jgi:hypothetical protein
VDWQLAIAPCAILLADFAQVIVARLWLGYAPWIADRRHLTHVLLNTGLPSWALAPLLAAAAWLAAGAIGGGA